MLSDTFRKAVEAELLVAVAHVERLRAFLDETTSNGKIPNFRHWDEEPAHQRKRGRPPSRPVKSLASINKMRFNPAVRALLQQYKGGLTTKEITEELRKRGVKPKGKAGLGTRVSLAVGSFKTRGHVKSKDGKHVWIQPDPEPVKSDEVKVLS